MRKQKWKAGVWRELLAANVCSSSMLKGCLKVYPPSSDVAVSSTTNPLKKPTPPSSPNYCRHPLSWLPPLIAPPHADSRMVTSETTRHAVDMSLPLIFCIVAWCRHAVVFFEELANNVMQITHTTHTRLPFIYTLTKEREKKKKERKSEESGSIS